MSIIVQKFGGSSVADAERIRKWVTTNHTAPAPVARAAVAAS